MAKNSLIWIRFEFVAFTFEELVLELYPMKSETMQEAFHTVHDHQHTEGNAPEAWPEDDSL